MRVHLHRVEHVDDVLQSAREGVELAEDVHFGELKLALVGHGLELGLSLVEGPLVLLVEPDTVLDLADDLWSGL